MAWLQEGKSHLLKPLPPSQFSVKNRLTDNEHHLWNGGVLDETGSW